LLGFGPARHIRDFVFAAAGTGGGNAATRARIAMATKSSMSVKPLVLELTAVGAPHLAPVASQLVGAIKPMVQVW